MVIFQHLMNFVLQSSALKFSLQKTSTRQYSCLYLPLCLHGNAVFSQILIQLILSGLKRQKHFQKQKYILKKKGAYILRNFFPHSN